MHDHDSNSKLPVYPCAPSCRACNIDEAYITNFGEEVVRGQPVFVLSILLRYLKPMLRTSAGVGNWQVRSASFLGWRVLLERPLCLWCVHGTPRQETGIGCC